MSFLVIREKTGYTLLKEHDSRKGYYWKYGSRVNLQEWSYYPLAAVSLAEDRLYERRTPLIIKGKNYARVDDYEFHGPSAFAIAHNYVLQYLGLNYQVEDENGPKGLCPHLLPPRRGVGG